MMKKLYSATIRNAEDAAAAAAAFMKFCSHSNKFYIIVLGHRSAIQSRGDQIEARWSFLALVAFHSAFPPISVLRNMSPWIQLGVWERCKQGLGQCPSRNQIGSILALKSDIWWQRFYFQPPKSRGDTTQGVPAASKSRGWGHVPQSSRGSTLVALWRCEVCLSWRVRSTIFFDQDFVEKPLDDFFARQPRQRLDDRPRRRDHRSTCGSEGRAAGTCRLLRHVATLGQRGGQLPPPDGCFPLTSIWQHRKLWWLSGG